MQTGAGELARHIVATGFGVCPREVVLDANCRVADAIVAGLSGFAASYDKAFMHDFNAEMDRIRKSK